MIRTSFFFFYLFSTSLFAKPVEIVFWHAMSGQLGNVLHQMVTQFNQEQTEYRVVARYKGEYAEALTSFAAAFRAHEAPALIQIYEVGTPAMLNPPGVIKPIEVLMKEQKLDLAIQDFLPGIREFYSRHGVLQAFPFNTSIPVIFYNADALTKAGIKQLPTTWQTFETVIKEVKQAHYPCGYTTAYPAWVQLESFAALHGLKRPYNQPAFINHLERLKNWQAHHDFEYGGRANNATSLFSSGRCVFFSQSLGAYRGLAHVTRFKLGIMPLPLDDRLQTSRHNNVLGGGALWAVAGQSPEVERGVAQFVFYLSKKETQRLLYEQTGYIPIGLSGYYADLSSTKPDLVLAQQDLSQTNDHVHTGSKEPSHLIRQVNDEAMEAIFAGIKSSQQALDEAAGRANYLKRRFKQQIGTI